MLDNTSRWSHARGNAVVPSCWQATRTFDDIDALAPGCRFPDCRHHQEPDCAVRGAVATGRLDPERLASYLKLRHELEVLEVRKDEKARRLHEKSLGRDLAVRRQEVRRNKPGSR